MNRGDVINIGHAAGFDRAHLSEDSALSLLTLLTLLERFAAAVEDRARVAERGVLMQLFTDPENQPTQHGTVTVEYMQREIAAEREACARVCESRQTPGTGSVAILNGAADAIRARGNT